MSQERLSPQPGGNVLCRKVGSAVFTSPSVDMGARLKPRLLSAPSDHFLPLIASHLPVATSPYDLTPVLSALSAKALRCILRVTPGMKTEDVA
jgi:hypothetical protein